MLIFFSFSHSHSPYHVSVTSIHYLNICPQMHCYSLFTKIECEFGSFRSLSLRIFSACSQILVFFSLNILKTKGSRMKKRMYSVKCALRRSNTQATCLTGHKSKHRLIRYWGYIPSKWCATKQNRSRSCSSVLTLPVFL